MDVSDIIPFDQRPELHILIWLRYAEGLESEEKNNLRVYGQAPRLVDRSWPVTQGQPFALHELTEGTVSIGPW